MIVDSARPACTPGGDWLFATYTTGTAVPRVRVWYERSGDTATAFALAKELETEIWPSSSGWVSNHR